MLKDPNHHIPKEFTESIYGVKVYCTYNSEPPTSIIIDAIRSLNSDDHYLSQVLHGIKNIYHKVVSPYTVEYKHFTTMLSIIAASETNPFTSDSGPLAPSWNFIAFWRYLDANPTRAIETFHKKFQSCTEIKVESSILLTSLHEYDPINDFAKLDIKLLGVLNDPISSEAYLEV